MSNAQELMYKARAAVGDAEDDDWRVNPSGHARAFDSVAPGLAMNLRRARPEGLAQMYEKQDAIAVRARDMFKATMRRADVAVFIASSLGALLLVAVGIQDLLGDAGRYVIGGIGGAGVLASSFAAMWVNRAKNGDLANRWSSERANAEARRLAYFKDVMDGAKDEPFDKLLALEYTRRFLLDSQIKYFQARGRQHEVSAQEALNRSTYATVIASLLTAAGGAVAVIEPKYSVVAGLGAVASYLSTLFISRSEMNLDRKNADRYRVAADQLAERRLDLDLYRTKVANGESEALADFYQPVFMALKADHQAFMSDGDQREMAIGEMQTDSMPPKNR